MTRCFSILPYSGWIFHRLLNILIFLSALFLWYLIITNQEALHWYFFRAAKCEEAEDQGNLGNQDGNHGNPIKEQLPPQQVEEVLQKEPKKEPAVVRAKFQPPEGPIEMRILQPEPEDVGERFTERNNVIKDLCTWEDNPDFEQSNMYHFPYLKATWAPVFGAGSTLWKKFFIDQYTTKRLNKFGDQYNLGYLGKFLLQYKKAKQGTGLKTRRFTKEPDDSLRFTIIRHPLSRLIAHFKKPQLDRGELSALKDQWVRPSIILGRNDPSWTDEQKEKFEGELDLWIDDKLVEKSPDNPLLSEPTFTEFVRFIVDADDKGDDRAYNVHWRPISEWLDICQKIVKLENVKSEIPPLLEKLNLLSHKAYFLDNAGKADDVNVNHFMGQLTRRDQERINDFYEMDYRYFGYQPIFVDKDHDTEHSGYYTNMARNSVILPHYIGWILSRLLNIFILLSALFLWYLIITNHFVAPDKDEGSAGPQPKDIFQGVEGTVPAVGQIEVQMKDESENTEYPRNQGNPQHVPVVQEGTVSPEELNDDVDTKMNPPQQDVVDAVPTEQDALTRFEQRNKVIKDVCEVEENPDFQSITMYYFQHLRATWLPLFGVSTTTLWQQFFIDQYSSVKRGTDPYNIGQLSRFLLQRYRSTRRWSGNKRRRMRREPDDSLRFTIIRHPLSRLIAHFRKPQLDRGELSALKDQWVRPSIILGRNDPSWTDEQREKFEGELDLWIDGKLTPEQSPENPLLAPPTFPEFIWFIIDGYEDRDERAYNDHWRPISERLDICQNDIDIIVKMENSKTVLRSVEALVEENPDFQSITMYYFQHLRATWLPLFGVSTTTLWQQFFIDQYSSVKRGTDPYNIGQLSRFLLQRYRSTRRWSGNKRRRMRREPDDSLRFTIIRHPLSRLIAHFRKPQLDRGELSALKDQWVRPSIILGRNDPSWTDEQREKFEGELDLWIDGKLTPEQSPENPLLAPPTFPEFIWFIIDGYEDRDERAYNDHWRPISERLDICQNDIDIIVKMENSKVELPVLLDEIHLSDHKYHFLDNADADDVSIEEYMGQLSREDQEDINEFYEMDYRLLGYQPIFVETDSEND
eukprot:sb/3461422/